MPGIGGPTIRQIFLQAVVDAPAEMWMSLWLASPTDAGEATPLGEVVGGSYTRVQVGILNEATPTVVNWVVDDDEARYPEDLIFPEATADWGTVLYWAIFDDETAGDVVLWGEFGGAEAEPIEAGAIVTIPGDTLTFSFRPTYTASA